MHACKVSVIIPIYNIEKYLAHCLDSITNQTLKDIEIICVNDGSTDNSPMILEQYASKDSRIKIINTQNYGLPSARNSGLKKAAGEYISFIDGDDWVDLNFLETLYSAANAASADIARAPYKECFGNRYVDAYIVPLFKRRFFENKYLGVNEHSVIVWNSIYRRDLLKSVFGDGDYFDKTILRAEDIPFTARTSFAAKKIIPVVDTYYYYRRNVENQLSIFSVKRAKSIVLANKIVVNFINSINTKTISNYLEAFNRVIWRYDDTFHQIIKIKEFTNDSQQSYVNCFIEEFHKCKYKDEFLKNYNKPYFIFLINKDIKGYINFCRMKKIRNFIRKIFSIDSKDSKKIFRILGIKIQFKYQTMDVKKKLSD
ncbi:MAG: glycosyltransferase [Endomicrobium sp.]|jgi:glycosyltransferase involved in cell wall biosynthesis|nr:glycosyltransferase [Endomicrobium sp.]